MLSRHYTVVTNPQKVRDAWKAFAEEHTADGIKFSKTKLQNEVAASLGISNYAVRKAMLGKEMFTKVNEEIKKEVYAEHIINGVSLKELASKHKISYNSARELMYEAQNRGWKSSPIYQGRNLEAHVKPRTISLPVLSNLESRAQEEKVTPTLLQSANDNTDNRLNTLANESVSQYAERTKGEKPLKRSNPESPEYPAWNTLTAPEAPLPYISATLHKHRTPRGRMLSATAKYAGIAAAVIISTVAAWQLTRTVNSEDNRHVIYATDQKIQDIKPVVAQQASAYQSNFVSQVLYGNVKAIPAPATNLAALVSVSGKK